MLTRPTRRPSTQVSNDRRMCRRTPADTGGRCFASQTWHRPGSPPASWLRDEEANSPADSGHRSTRRRRWPGVSTGLSLFPRRALAHAEPCPPDGRRIIEGDPGRDTETAIAHLFDVGTSAAGNKVQASSWWATRAVCRRPASRGPSLCLVPNLPELQHQETSALR
jgi:hypothetical protein